MWTRASCQPRRYRLYLCRLSCSSLRATSCTRARLRSTNPTSASRSRMGPTCAARPTSCSGAGIREAASCYHSSCSTYGHNTNGVECQHDVSIIIINGPMRSRTSQYWRSLPRLRRLHSGRWRRLRQHLPSGIHRVPKRCLRKLRSRILTKQ